MLGREMMGAWAHSKAVRRFQGQERAGSCENQVGGGKIAVTMSLSRGESQAGGEGGKETSGARLRRGSNRGQQEGERAA